MKASYGAAIVYATYASRCYCLWLQCIVQKPKITFSSYQSAKILENWDCMHVYVQKCTQIWDLQILQIAKFTTDFCCRPTPQTSIPRFWQLLQNFAIFVTACISQRVSDGKIAQNDSFQTLLFTDRFKIIRNLHVY